jgi:hypothetical protein
MTVRPVGLAAATALTALLVTGCGSKSGPGAATGSAVSIATTGSARVPPDELQAYVSAVEKVRLPVNALLNGADPILDAYHDHRISGPQASRRMGALEERFAAYTVQMQQIAPSNPRLAALNRPYAHTYFYEDSYLATLASDLAEGDFDNLPDTQAAQRLAIVVWRTDVEVVAAQTGITLPGDIQQAGRGEIAPAPDGS